MEVGDIPDNTNPLPWVPSLKAAYFWSLNLKNSYDVNNHFEKLCSSLCMTETW